MPIPADDVDPEQIAKPRPWHMGEIARFILFVGPCSSIFDYTTYFMMLYVCSTAGITAKASLFQTGWFVESLLTQTLIIHVIRTNRIPFLQSRASWPLTVTTAIIMAVGIWLPFSPIAHWLGLHAAAAALLAVVGADAVLLRRSDAGRQDVADPQGVDLMAGNGDCL